MSRDRWLAVVGLFGMLVMAVIWASSPGTKESSPAWLSQIAAKYDPVGASKFGSGHLFLPIYCALAPPSAISPGVQYATIWMDINTRTGRLYPSKVVTAPDGFTCPDHPPYYAPKAQVPAAVPQSGPSEKPKTPKK